MKRAADSISLNIAEGSTGQFDMEQLRFLGYSQRSGMEVVNCLYLALRRKYIDQEQFDKLYRELELLTIKIKAFKKSIKSIH
jgi:four helix bundle protein